mmetsp:Transcript_23303/g.38602  ORF Transcript_23303/g.38602 Transcript_23303/m.38602 type:complete len:177 (+) Transcript_23303:61-591(+)
MSSAEQLLTLLLRKGVIPICSTGASFCFALYSAKLSHAAGLWRAASIQSQQGGEIAGNSSSIKEETRAYHSLKYHRGSVQVYVQELMQHSGTCLCLSLVSGAVAREAYLDWQHYGATTSASEWKEMAVQLWRRQQPYLFFVRPPVLIVACLSLATTHRLYGGWKFWQPEPPMHYYS